MGFNDGSPDDSIVGCTDGTCDGVRDGLKLIVGDIEGFIDCDGAVLG